MDGTTDGFRTVTNQTPFSDNKTFPTSTTNAEEDTIKQPLTIQSLYAWEVGEPRESVLHSSRVDPAEKDPQTAEWHQITIKVEGKDLFAQAAQLAAVSPILRQMISEIKKPKPPPPTEKKGPQRGGLRAQPPQTAKSKIPAPNRPTAGRRVGLVVQKEPPRPKTPDYLQIQNCSYSDFYDFLLTLQPQGLMPEARTIHTNNVIGLLELAKRFQISFLWDHALLVLKEDIKESNILRHYCQLRKKGIHELEEIFFNLCLELLREAEIQQLEADHWFKELDKDAQIHLRIALIKTNRCLMCGSQKFPWNIQITCPKCRDVRSLQHKMCDTQSREFVRLNQCRKCKVRMLDVQWVWGMEQQDSRMG